MTDEIKKLHSDVTRTIEERIKIRDRHIKERKGNLAKWDDGHVKALEWIKSRLNQILEEE